MKIKSLGVQINFKDMLGNLFRPFIGYKDIRVVHKEPRRSGDKAMTLCFVEFVDSKCALTALEALQV
ncbi:unnamed protein product [Sphenostylis stenocarpa]|uniref:RRM domain-containing protein n=1 Tax=Sphenostylis stenocarpa TaxID=92480 RepID=A0AA86SVD1_9FABA|nr:unnamed protein product [Sphenostylis stenocarpa]